MNRGRLGRSCKVMAANGPIPADEDHSPFERVEDGVPCVDVGLRDETDQVGRGALRPGAACKAGLNVVELEPARGRRRRGEQSARLFVAATLNRLLGPRDCLRVGIGRRLRRGCRRGESYGESECGANGAEIECANSLHRSVLLLRQGHDSRDAKRARCVLS
jgi:hypothetical protein